MISFLQAWESCANIFFNTCFCTTAFPPLLGEDVSAECLQSISYVVNY